MGHMTTEGDESEIGMVFKEAAQSSEGQLYLNADFLPIEFRQLSEHMAFDIVQYICHHEDAPPAPNKTIMIMRSLVDDTLRNRLDFMHDLVLRVNLEVLEVLTLTPPNPYRCRLWIWPPSKLTFILNSGVAKVGFWG